MKSFGYTQRSVSKLVLIEIVLLSLIGTAIGVPLGIWLGDLFMQELLSMLQFDIVYTLNWRLPAIMAVTVGVLFPVLFSLFPIYHAGRTSILLTLKMASQSKGSSRPLLIRAVVGLVLLCFVFIDHSVTYAAVLAGVILLFPLLLAGLSRIIKPVLNFLFHYAGSLAAKSLFQQINRNANTAAILGIGISVILLLGAVVESAPEGYEQEIRNTYGEI